MILNPLQTGTYYLGTYIQHSPIAIFALESLLNEHKPGVIIEIGTGWGGTAMYLSSWASLNDAQLHTFNIQEQASEKVTNFIAKNGGEYYFTDVFTDDARNSIKNLMNSNSKVFIYCDGGNKTKELAYFSKYTKCGDVIGCHDYTTEVCPPLIDNFMKETGFDKIPDENFRSLQTLQMFWVDRKETKNGKKDIICSSDELKN